MIGRRFCEVSPYLYMTSIKYLQQNLPGLIILSSCFNPTTVPSKTPVTYILTVYLEARLNFCHDVKIISLTLLLLYNGCSTPDQSVKVISVFKQYSYFIIQRSFCAFKLKPQQLKYVLATLKLPYCGNKFWLFMQSITLDVKGVTSCLSRIT